MRLFFDEAELAQLVAEALEQRGYDVGDPADAVSFEDNDSDNPVSVIAYVDVGDLPELEDTDND